MAVIEGGTSAAVAEVGAAAAKGLHVQLRPFDAGALGHYRLASVSGTMAAALAAGSQIFQFKWTDATRFAVVTSLKVRFLTLTRFTAGTITDFGVDAFIARTYTGGSGGTALTITGDNGALRAAYGTTLVSEIRVPTTAALGAVTTLDTQPFTQGFGAGVQVTPSATVQYETDNIPLLDYQARTESGESPVILAQNEGIIVRNRAVWPIAGTGIYSFEIQWSEVTAF